MNQFVLPNNEGVPTFNFLMGEKSFECTPENTTAYVHSPAWKDVDHIFLELESGEEAEATGLFVFRGIIAVKFNPIVAEMEESGFTVVNKEQPADMDYEQYVGAQRAELDEWWDYLTLK